MRKRLRFAVTIICSINVVIVAQIRTKHANLSMERCVCFHTIMKKARPVLHDGKISALVPVM